MATDHDRALGVIGGSKRRDFLKTAAVAGLGATAAGGLLVDTASAHGRGRGRHSWGLPGEASLGGNIGKSLEWVSPLDPTPNGAPDTVAGPNVNCRDIHRSFAFYRDVMGFDMQIRLNPSTPQPGTNGSLGDTVRTPKGEIWTGLTDFDAAIMVPRTDGRNSVDLLEWQMPGSYGTPYKEANHLGAVNLAWEVNSVDVVYEKLRRLLKNPSRQIVSPPETWDLGDYGVRKVLNILDPDGVMLQFMEKIYSADPTP